MSEFTSNAAAMRLSLRALERLQRNVGAGDGRTSQQVEADDERRAEEERKLSALSPYQRTEFLTARAIQELREMMRRHQELTEASGTRTNELTRGRQEMRKLEDKITKMGRDAARLARSERRDGDAVELLKHVKAARKYYRQRFGIVASGYDGEDNLPFSDHDDARGSSTSFNRLSPAARGGEAAPLLTGSSRAIQGDDPFPSTSPTAASLREDDEFQAFFIKLQESDALMEKQFDRIHAGVHRLRERADGIKAELSIQSALIDEVETKVDRSNEKLFSLNRKLKKTLEQVDSSRMCVYVFCLLVVLGLTGGILYVTHVIGPSDSNSSK